MGKYWQLVLGLIIGVCGLAMIAYYLTFSIIACVIAAFLLAFYFRNTPQ